MICDRMQEMPAAPLHELPRGPRVTALIVAHNSAGPLRTCIDALESSSLGSTLEIIVVDNGSTDGTPELSVEYPTVTFLRLPKNFGLTKGINIGTRTAKSEMILLVSPNVEVAPDTVALLADRLESDSSAGAVCPYVPRVYPFPDPEMLKTAWRTGQLPGGSAVNPSSAALEVDYPAGAPILVWRRSLKSMNYVDERYGQYWADLELCHRIRTSGRKIVVIPEARVNYLDSSAADDAVYSADCASGAAAYLGKRYGFSASLKFRLGALLTTLAHAATFRRPGYNLKRLTALASGRKIDGTQE